MTEERLKEIFNKNSSPLKICIGSWLAYNECNKHALGTCYNNTFYADFTELESEEEMYEMLDALGWTKEEQEELFVQDYESNCGITLGNCDYINPGQLIDFITMNEVDLNKNGEKLATIMEYESLSFEQAAESLDNYMYYEGYTAEQYEEELFYDGLTIEQEEMLNKYWFSGYISIDFEQMARDDDSVVETDRGILVRC